jgi:hypothetical protein
MFRASCANARTLHLGWCHFVEQAISLNEEVPDVGLVEFGN